MIWLTGHLPNPTVDAAEALYRDHPELSSASPSGSEDSDLRPVMPKIRQQKNQNCVAHSASALIRVIAKLSGTPLPWDEDPSVAQLYTNARLRRSPRAPLVDNGSSLRALFDAVGEEGIVPESVWPEDPAKVNEIPPDDVWRQGETITISRAHRLSDGRQSSPEIRECLKRGRPSTMCMMVDERFANVGSSVYGATGGRVIGSHCMLVVGYVSILDAFIVRNSWGEDFGDLGYCLVAADIVDRLSYEKYTIDVGLLVRRPA